MDRGPDRVGRREFIGAVGGIGLGGAYSGLATGRPPSSRQQAGTPTTPDSRVELVVRFKPAHTDTASESTAALRQHARTTKRAFRRTVSDQPGITIDREFWVANAAVVTVDLGTVPRDRLRGIDGVVGVHPNYGGTVRGAIGDEMASDSRQPGSPHDQMTDDVTFNVDMVDADAAWEFHGTRGEGVDVAVLDTGVVPDGHPGLAESLSRGGRAVFDDQGNRVETSPTDPIGHGTAVSGIIAGQTNDSGTHYGVAPGVNLYNAKIETGDSQGVRFAGVVAGLEWALEHDVDVVSLSFGLLRYDHSYIEPVRNVTDSGALVVAGAGNNGHYTSGSPANLPGTVGVGNVDGDGEIVRNSGGEQVRTDRYWGDEAPDSWESAYMMPTVVAPGDGVPVPQPGGTFRRAGGTSMATPAVSGVAALVVAATDADRETVTEALTATAQHPSKREPFEVDPGHDDRYGTGVVSAMRAISSLRASEPLTGTVVDADGHPLSEVRVASEAGVETTTDSQGHYSITLPPGEQPVGAGGLGYTADTTTLDPASAGSQDFRLEPHATPEISMTDEMVQRVDPGTATSAAFGVANVDSVTVDVTTEGLLDRDQLELTVDGTQAAFREPVSLPETRRGDRVRIGVTPRSDVLIGEFSLSYEFAGADGTRTGSGQVVHVHSDPFELSPEDPPSLQIPIDLVAPGTTIELRDGVANERVADGTAAALVIDKPVTLTAAGDASPRIRFAGNENTEAPAVVAVNTNDVTLSGLAIDGDGAAAAVRVGAEYQGGETPIPSGVTVEQLSLAGASTGIDAYTAPALRLENNDISAERTGISVGGRASTVVRENTVGGGETGIAVTGQVAGIEANDITDVSGAGIRLETPRLLIDQQAQAIGPLRANRVSAAETGIVVSGFTNRPIEGNELTDIAGAAILVEGGVLAPIRSNTIERAQQRVVVGDGAEVATVTNNGPGQERDADGDTPQSSGTTPASEGSSAETPTADSGDGETAGERATGGSSPGFGIGATVAALGSVSYLVKQRLVADENS